MAELKAALQTDPLVGKYVPKLETITLTVGLRQLLSGHCSFPECRYGCDGHIQAKDDDTVIYRKVGDVAETGINTRSCRFALMVG